MSLFRPSSLYILSVGFQFIYTVERGIPIRGSRHIPNHILRDIPRHKRTNRMTDEYVREFDTPPKFLPNLRLRRARHRNQIAANMNVTAENNRPIRSHFFGNRDQRYHLRIIDDDNMSASFGWRLERSFAREPVAFGIFEDPVGDMVVVFCAEAFVGLGDALEDVVVCFGDAEDAGAWFGDVPVVVKR